MHGVFLLRIFGLRWLASSRPFDADVPVAERMII